MKTCPSCGRTYSDIVTTCPACGCRLNSMKSRNINIHHSSDECDRKKTTQKLEENRIIDAGKKSSHSPNRSQRTTNKKIIAGFVCFILAAIGFGILSTTHQTSNIVSSDSTHLIESSSIADIDSSSSAVSSSSTAVDSSDSTVLQPATNKESQQVDTPVYLNIKNTDHSDKFYYFEGSISDENISLEGLQWFIDGEEQTELRGNKSIKFKVDTSLSTSRSYRFYAVLDYNGEKITSNTVTVSISPAPSEIKKDTAEEKSTVTSQSSSATSASESAYVSDKEILGVGIYTGAVNDKGKPSGEGTMKYTCGDTYEGSWKNGMPDGYGKMIYADGSAHKSYEGNWKKGKPEGYGTMVWPAERPYSSYTGEFSNGKMHGEGTMTYSNGNIYAGEWNRGQMHGQGTMTYSDGKIKSGLWQYGKFLGGRVTHP